MTQTFAEFKLTRRFADDLSKVPELVSYDPPASPAFIYNGAHNWIDIHADGVFTVILGNSELSSRNLEELEAELWNYVLTL